MGIRQMANPGFAESIGRAASIGGTQGIGEGAAQSEMPDIFWGIGEAWEGWRGGVLQVVDGRLKLFETTKSLEQQSRNHRLTEPQITRMGADIVIIS